MRNYSVKKWFWIGFGIRAIFAVVVFLMALKNFESLMLYFLDVPTMLVLALAETILPRSLFGALAGGDPLYIPMNLLGCLLWGGAFTLIPLTRNFVFRLRRNQQIRKQSAVIRG